MCPNNLPKIVYSMDSKRRLQISKFQLLSIGAGYFARFQMDAWARLPSVALNCVMDTSSDARAKAGLDFGYSTTASGFSDVQSDLCDFDVIDIATPPQTHIALISRLIEEITDRSQKAPIIICQKPFCENISQAESVCIKAAQKGVPLVIHENFRFQPWYRAIKSVIESGSLGRIYQARFSLRTGDGQGGKAYLQRQPYFQTMEKFLIHETAIHFIDTFRYLFGEPSGVYAHNRRLNPAISGEDAATLIFDYDSDLQLIFDGNRLADHQTDNTRRTFGEFRIEGSKGTLDLNGQGEIRLRQHGEMRSRTLDYDWQDQGFAGDSVFAFQQHIVEHLQTGRPLETEAEAYLKNMSIEALAYESAASQRRMKI